MFKCMGSHELGDNWFPSRSAYCTCFGSAKVLLSLLQHKCPTICRDCITGVVRIQKTNMECACTPAYINQSKPDGNKVTMMIIRYNKYEL